METKIENYLARVLKKIVLAIPAAKKLYHIPGLTEFYQSINNLVRYGTLDFFNSVEIETITTCNRKCEYCSNAFFTRPNALMDTNVYTKIIDGLSEINFNGRVSPHFYGEPLLDKRLPQLTEYTRKKLPLATIVVYSNGDYLTKELFDRLIASGVDAFDITQHDAGMSKTMKQLFSQLTKEQKKKIHYRVFTEKTPLSTRGGLIQLKDVKKVKKCNQTKGIVIDYKGNVVLCCEDYSSKNILGNVREERLIDIWRKKNYKMIRSELKNGIFTLDICKRCGVGHFARHSTK